MRGQFVAQVARAVRAAFGRLLAQLDDLVRQPVDQLLLLEQGQLDVLVESETIRLNAGDTTVVQSNLPHIVSNPGDTTAVGLAVFTPAIWFPNNRRSFNRGGET